MNIKSVYLMMFISFFIFSTIGCISEYTPDGDVILNEEHQSQEFVVDNDVYDKLEWYFDDILIKRDNTTGDISNFTLNRNDHSNGNHILRFDNGIDTITWNINVIKYDEQDLNIIQEKQFNWNDVRNEWKEKSNNIIYGEDI